MSRFLFPSLGAALVLLVAVDIFSTVFHASGRGGPINRRQNRILWAAFRRFGIADGNPRHHLLAFSGPLLIVSTLGVWIHSLVIGYALIYLPFMETYLVSPGRLRTPLVEAIYYSALTSPTVGTGDLVPNLEAIRLITAVEALTGFAAASAAITYLLSIYSELAVVRTTANGIAVYFCDGLDRTLERIAAAGTESFTRWAEALTANLLAILQAQFQYPVLPYFHATRLSRALPVQLERLVELERRLSRGEVPEAISRLHEHPSYCALRRALEEYLEITEEYFIPRQFEVEAAAAARTNAERARRRLAVYMGYPS